MGLIAVARPMIALRLGIGTMVGCWFFEKANLWVTEITIKTIFLGTLTIGLVRIKKSNAQIRPTLNSASQSYSHREC